MDPLNYFKPNLYNDVFILSLYATIMTFDIFINALFMWKAYRQFNKQQRPIFKQGFVRNYFLTMISLFIMPLGSYIGNWVRFLTGFQYQIFSSENNFFVSIGYIFSIIFFLGYIGSILHSPFFQKRETVWNRAFKGASIVALIAALFIHRSRGMTNRVKIPFPGIVIKPNIITISSLFTSSARRNLPVTRLCDRDDSRPRSSRLVQCWTSYVRAYP